MSLKTKILDDIIRLLFCYFKEYLQHLERAENAEPTQDFF